MVNWWRTPCHVTFATFVNTTATSVLFSQQPALYSIGLVSATTWLRINQPDLSLYFLTSTESMTLLWGMCASNLCEYIVELITMIVENNGVFPTFEVMVLALSLKLLAWHCLWTVLPSRKIFRKKEIPHYSVLKDEKYKTKCPTEDGSWLYILFSILISRKLIFVIRDWKKVISLL